MNNVFIRTPNSHLFVRVPALCTATQVPLPTHLLYIEPMDQHLSAKVAARRGELVRFKSWAHGIHVEYGCMTLGFFKAPKWPGINQMQNSAREEQTIQQF